MLELVLLGSIICEWLLYVVRPFWLIRRAVVVVPLVASAATAAAYTVENPGWLAVAVAYVTVFRVINLLRISQARMNERYLYGATRRTGLILGVVQALLVAAGLVLVPGWSGIWMILAGLQVVFAAATFVVTLRNIVKSRHHEATEHFADRDLPTVSVAVPARNETADLEDCLRSILANNYPKFEVLVLDDCSQDKTPDIIRGFAQEGVRFIKGQPPQDRWLAKNQAYHQLATEATGDLILFCGVDVRFGPETIRALVTELLVRKKEMVSVMPRRLTSDWLTAFIQPMRYWWELALPRRYFNRPPVLSTCWIIRRKTLKKLGGFAAVQHAIIPEGFFARELVRTDAYSFLRADDVLDVQTRKKLADQRETAIRTRYPQLRRRPEWAMLLIMAEVFLLLGPFAGVLSAIWVGFGWLQLLSAVALGLAVLTHMIIVQVSNPANVLVSAVNLPVVVVTELLLGIVSMYKYEFSTVDWKGRNVCIPVMHVIPKLPPLPDKPPK